MIGELSNVVTVSHDLLRAARSFSIAVAVGIAVPTSATINDNTHFRKSVVGKNACRHNIYCVHCFPSAADNPRK
jgi:hypothetical protein